MKLTVENKNKRGANSSGLSGTRHQKAGQKLVKSWSKGGHFGGFFGFLG